MTRGRLLASAAAGFTLFALAAPASAAGFANGSFETNTCGVGVNSFGTVGTGGTCITSWTVGSGSVDLVRENYWDAHHGEYSVDLAGSVPGSITQIFDTVVGNIYTVSYWLSANREGGNHPFKDGSVAVVINGNFIAGGSIVGVDGPSNANMQYRNYFFDFKATGNSTSLTFAAASDETAYGPVLDAVSVTNAVPEPATWAMMLLGFGAVGFGLRKRKAGQGETRLRVAYV
jgi:choice-of-anchor C domain-containing protein